MRKKWAAVVLLIGITGGLILGACGRKQTENSANKETKVESDAKDSTAQDGKVIFGTFQTKTLEGEDVTQELFQQADLTMVNIWGTFCGPCINEMPELGEISREYAGKGLQIVGLVSDVSEVQDATAKEIVEKTQADYLQIIASEDLTSGILTQINEVPTTIFVDKEGKQVGDVILGAKNKEQWIRIIEGLKTSL